MSTLKCQSYECALQPCNVFSSADGPLGRKKLPFLVLPRESFVLEVAFMLQESQSACQVGRYLMHNSTATGIRESG